MVLYQKIGLGTYKLQGEHCIDIIKNGLEIGYRQIDTAQLYHNHKEIAVGIKNSGIKRDDIFLISKIHNKNIKKIQISESIDQIKKELDTDYIDLILLHNPVKNYDLSWKELIRCKNHFNIKNIGVSNFEINHLDNIITHTNISPYLNQIELNIFNQQKKLIEYHNKNNIITQSHTSLTKCNLINNKNLIDLSNELNYKPVDLMFLYILNQNIGILPKTTNIEHLKSNLYLFNNNYKINNVDFSNFDIGYKIY